MSTLLFPLIPRRLTVDSTRTRLEGPQLHQSLLSSAPPLSTPRVTVLSQDSPIRPPPPGWCVVREGFLSWSSQTSEARLSRPEDDSLGTRLPRTTKYPSPRRAPPSPSRVSPFQDPCLPPKFRGSHSARVVNEVFPDRARGSAPHVHTPCRYDRVGHAPFSLRPGRARPPLASTGRARPGVTDGRLTSREVSDGPRPARVRPHPCRRRDTPAAPSRDK